MAIVTMGGLFTRTAPDPLVPRAAWRNGFPRFAADELK